MLHRSLLAIGLASFLIWGAPATAMFDALDDGRVSQLREARWETIEGETRVGLNGSKVLLLSSEGYDMTHPDLEACGDEDHHALLGAGALSPDAPRNDLDSHGNLIAGVVCGSGVMSDGRVVGVAPGATLFSAPVACIGMGEGCGLAPWFTDTDLRVLTHSRTSDPVKWAETRGMPEGQDIFITLAVGNTGGDGTRSTTGPGLDDPRVLGVAAANGREGVADYSSRGDAQDPTTWPDLTAPGCLWSVSPPPWVDAQTLAVYRIAGEAAVENTTGSSLSDCPPPPPPPDVAKLVATGYARAKGTSMAAPFVAGVAALMLEVNPTLNTEALSYLLTRTADPFLPTNDTNGDGEVSPAEFHAQHGFKAGWGYINATAAVTAAHHQLLHPSVPLQGSVRCSSTTVIDGKLHLNPGETPCLVADKDRQAAQAGPPRSNASTLRDDRQPQENATGSTAGDPAENRSQRSSGEPAPDREATTSVLAALAALILSGMMHRRTD